MGRRYGQPDGDLHASDLRAPGRGYGQGSRPMLPRLVSGMDALAQLADERNGHRRLRFGGGAWQCRRPQPAVSYSIALGRRYYWPRRASATGLATVRNAHDRGHSPASHRYHWRLLDPTSVV